MVHLIKGLFGSVATERLAGKSLLWARYLLFTALALPVPGGFAVAAESPLSLYEKEIVSAAPVSFWSMTHENGVGTDLMELHPATVRNSPSLGEGLDLEPEAATKFDLNLNQRFVVPDSEAHNLSQFSIEAWVKVEEFGLHRAIVTKMISSPPYPGMALRLEDTNRFQFRVYVESEILTANSDNEVEAGRWYHLVGTYEDGIGIKLYVNGILDSEDAVEGESVIQTPTAPVVIGSHYDDDRPLLNFSGDIDNVAFYDRILGLAEVKRHYLLGQVNPTSGHVIVEANGVVDSELDLIGLDYKEVEPGLFLMLGDISAVAPVFATNDTKVVPDELLNPLAKFFTDPISVEALGKKLYVNVTSGRDVHAGNGPNGKVTALQPTDMASHVFYNNLHWSGSYYGPNWVKDETNNYYIYNNKSGNLDGNNDIWKTVYRAETELLAFYMNYGGAQLTTLAYAPISGEVSGGENRGTVDFEIPATPRKLFAHSYVSAAIANAGIQPNSIHTSAVSKLPVKFFSGIVPESFTAEDVSLHGANGAIAIRSIDPITESQFEIVLDAPLESNGTYSLRVGPNIDSPSVTGMDQNFNGIAGEQDDVFELEFELFIADHVIKDTAIVSEDDLAFLNTKVLVDGGVLQLQGNYQFNSLRLANGGKVTPPSGVRGDLSKINLTVTDELIVDAGSVISVTGVGYGPVDGQPGHVGGSHGGRGGNYSSSQSLAVYGDAREPLTLGQGGHYPTNRYISYGGGALKIQAMTATVDGVIEANGIKGSRSSTGGGAGGSVWLEVQTLRLGETARVQANGGYSEYGGSGSGGRVAIHYATQLGQDLAQASRAVAGNSGNISTVGAAGTVYWHDVTTDHSVLRVDNGSNRNGNWTELTSLPADLDELQVTNSRVLLAVDEVARLVVDNGTVKQATALTIGEQMLTNGSSWLQNGQSLTTTESFSFQQSTFTKSGPWTRPGGDQSLTVSDFDLVLRGAHSFERLEVASDGVVRVQRYNSAIPDSGSLQLTVDELVVAEGAQVSATGAGYGPVDGQPGHVGGSHGGRGGDYSSSQSLAVYGDAREPLTLGQGGHYPTNRYISYGGGALKIQATTATVDGVIEANGIKGSRSSTGGGAGGSIWLQVQTLRLGDASQIKANGGYSEYGGSGSGGRVAIHYATQLGQDLAQASRAVAGNSGNISTVGAAGTVYWHDVTTDHSVLRVDNGSNRNGNWTELTSLPTDLDELQVTNSRVLLAVDEVARLVVDNGTVKQATALTVGEQMLTNGSSWLQNGQSLTTTESFSFQQSTFTKSGPWTRPGNDQSLTVSDFDLVLRGAHSFERLEVASDGVVRVQRYNSAIPDSGSLQLTVDELVVAEGAQVSATGAGYGPVDGQPGHVGGSHGGRGGNYSSSQSLAVYGDAREPLTLGQGGHYPTNRYISYGGGALKIQATTATVDGVIEANGIKGSRSSTGGGAGGSVWLEVQTLRLGETARVQANGGYSEYGGSGSGGRVAIYYATQIGRDLTEAVSVIAGNSGNSSYAGQPGTIVTEQIQSPTAVSSTSINPAWNNALSAFDIWFINEIDPASFGADDISLTGPQGQVGVTQITKLDAVSYHVELEQALGDGAYQLQVGPNIQSIDGFGMDQDGNGVTGEPGDVYGFDFTIDTQPPSPVVLTSHNAAVEQELNVRKITLAGTRSEKVSIWINGVQRVGLGTGEWEVADLALKEGANDLVMMAVDEAQNHSQWISLKVDVDSIAPVKVKQTPFGHLSEAPATIQVEASDSGSGLALAGTTVLVKRDGVSISGSVSLEGNTFTFTPSAQLLEGSYSVTTRLADQRGNVSGNYGGSFVLDYTPPQQTLLDAYPSTTSINQFTFKGTKEAYSAVLLNGNQIVSGNNNSGWTHTVDLVEGDNTFSFQLRDRAGNLSEPTVATIRYDDTVPGAVPVAGDVEGEGTSVALDWSGYDEVANGNDIKQYLVFVQPSPFGSINGLAPHGVIPAGTKTLTLENLQRNTPIYVAVVAEDIAGLKLDSVTSVEMTPVDTVAPADTTQLQVASAATSLKLGWLPAANDDADLAGYRVYIEKAGTVETHDLAVGALTMEAGEVVFDVPGLEPATAYPVKVTTYDNNGNESEGVTNPGVTLLANPVTVTPEAFSGKVGLSWSATEPGELVKQYRVYVSTATFSSVEGMVAKASVAGNRQTAEVAGLQNGITYYVAVTAVNLSGGEEASVTPVEVTPKEDLDGPEIAKITHFDGSSETLLNDGDTITRNGSIRIYAEDPSGLSRAELQANGSGIGGDYTASPAFEMPWNLIEVDDGLYELTAQVYDTLNNVNEQSLSVNVALEPPAAPVIGAPKTGTTTNQSSVAVSGQSVTRGLVRFTVNGSLQGDAVTTNAQGQFSGSVTLAEGDNTITMGAAYEGRGVYGAASTSVTVTLDSTAPDAPQSLSAQSKPLGQIALGWSAVEGAEGYHLYRASSAFADVQGATRVNSQLIKGTTYQDLPSNDGEYHYRVVSVNELGTESVPSSSAKAMSDSTAPQALEIRYSPQGNQDLASGRVGPGRVDVELVFNEPLKTTPYLAMTISGGLPMVAELNPDYADDTLYTGHFVIKESTLSGTAMAVLSAHDQVGNRGTDVLEGKTLTVDTQGPEVAKLQLNPSDPIKNDPDENGLGQEVEVVLTLADDVMSGEQPTLVPFIFNGSQDEVIADYSAGIPLTQDGASQPGAPVYAGRFRLPTSAGQDDAGEPTAEVLGFQYSARDDLDNQTSKIAGNPRFQVYQGDLPPVTTPFGLTGKALPGGKVELRWNEVDGAAGYKLYRQAPGEAELTELVELSYPDDMRYLDGNSASLMDGTYQYAIASVRAQNGQSAESARSEPIEVSADATPPDAPENLSLELTGSGIVARWQPPASEVQDGLLKYNLYRLDLPADSEPGDVAGYTPLQNGIPDIIALDSRPSATDHLYVVTAVDQAGNESAPSNSQYLNVDLLPVSDLSISLAEQGRPVLHWSHAKASAVSFDVYRKDANGDVVKLNQDPLAERNFEDLSYNDGEPVSGAPRDRLYSVVAVDANEVNSIGHDLLMPALSASLIGGDGEGDAANSLERGVMNKVLYRVANAGETTVVQARLKVTLMDNGTPREHWSERFTVAPGGFTDVPVIIGGYDKLPTLASMDIQIVLEPKPGQSVQIQQQEEILVGQSGLVATLETEDFVRGAAGKVRLRLENPSDVETEVLMATAKGTKDSTEVRLVLKDLDGNILSKQAIRQVTGDVVSLTNGDTVARVPANGNYLSQAFDVAVPSSAPDQVRVHLELDRFRYHTGRDTFVAIGGTRASREVSLKETPYYGEVTGVAPAKVFVGDSVEIQGQAIDRASQAPLANVPLTLVLTSRGFERTFPLYTDAAGSFAYTFKPGASESGEYRVSVLHPRMLERPEHGTFTVEGAGVSPTRARLTIPRNYEYGLNIKVQAGHATQLNNVRLAYAPATDAEGNPLPALEGMQFDLGAPQQIAANQNAYLKLKFSGDVSAVDSGTLRFHVLADNRSQPLDTVTVEYFLTEAKPILLPQPSVVNTGVGLGQSQQESFSLKNTGLEQARNLSISLVTDTGAPAPDWFKLLTPAAIGSLAVGEQTEVQVALSPDASVPMADYLFKVRVEGDNLSAIEVPVLVAATDSATGNVFFHTTDIYTATLDEDMQPIPGLGNVKIKLQNTQVLSEVFDLTTDANGYGELTDIPAGRYSYRASAFDHEAVSGHLWVKPGVTNQEQLFLMNNLINVEFSVTEITLEDRYDIVLKATYETNVPVPVVVFEPMSVNLPMLKKGEVFQGEFTLSNHGLIEAYDVKTTLPTGDDYARFDYLVDIPDVLSPGQVVRVPYRIVALQDFEPSGEGEASGGGCVQRSYKALCNYSAECAVGTIIHNAATMIWNAISGSACGGTGGGGSIGGGFFGGGYFSGGGGTNYSPVAPTAIGTAESFCPGEDGSGEDCGGNSGSEGGG